jgi:transposase
MSGENKYSDTSVEELRRLLSEKDATIVNQENLIANQKSRIENLSSENAKLKKALFGKKSEKLSKEDLTQGSLFNEIEVSAGPPDEDESENETENKTTVRSHIRSKRGRKPLPADLPRVTMEHDLSDSEKTCHCGCELKRIGEDSAEKLRIIPMKIEVERHIYYKYVCPECSRGPSGPISDSKTPEVISLPREISLIPGSIITPSLFAFLIISKFKDSLPFYRLESIFKRFKVDLTRATMSAWAIRIARDSRRLRKILFDELQKALVMHLDETTVQVLKEPGRAASSESRMWTYRSTTDQGTVVLYEYRMTRKGDFLKKRLKDFQGVYVCDGYDGYNHLERQEGYIRAGCWAHVRRKFFEALHPDSFSSIAKLFLDKLGILYKYEDEFRNMLPQKRQKKRQEFSRPVVFEIENLLKKHIAGVPPGSDLGKALRYLSGQWPYLQVFLENGSVPIDNNLMENDIRPFALGRKNWLFSDTQKGASASAFYYSLIQTAVANRHEPFWYLLYLFHKLPSVGKDKAALRGLLPMYVSPTAVSEFCKQTGYN